MEPVEYYERSNYGHTRKYPVSKEALKTCALIGKLTLSDDALKILAEYGHPINKVEQPQTVAASKGD